MINDSIAKSLYKNIKHCKNHKLKSLLKNIHQKTFFYNKDGNFVVRGMYKEINHKNGVRELLRPNGVVVYLCPINGIDHLGLRYTNIQNNTPTEEERNFGRSEKEQISRTIDVLFAPDGKLLKFSLIKKSIFKDSIFNEKLNHEDVVERIYNINLKQKRRRYNTHKAIVTISDITGDVSNAELTTNYRDIKSSFFKPIDLVDIALKDKLTNREFTYIEKCVNELPTPQVNKDKELTKSRTNLPMVKEESKVPLQDIIATILNKEDEMIK
ncbi:MAG: hypothetical protein IK070_01635 [Clostridia bacterium]|nr:hypothetical protein [Clostridia bacterium]